MVDFVEPQGDVESLPLPPEHDGPIALLGTGRTGPSGLLACASDACWIDGSENAIARVDPVRGGAIETFPLPTSLDRASDLACDGRFFYVMGGSSAGRRQLGRISLDGSESVVLGTMGTGEGNWFAGAGSLAVDDACVYWSNTLGIFSLDKTSDGGFVQ